MVVYPDISVLFIQTITRDWGNIFFNILEEILLIAFLMAGEKHDLDLKNILFIF